MTITIGSDLRTEDERDRMTVAVGYVPTMGEALGAKVSEGFKMTTTRILGDEMRISAAEKEAYGGIAGPDYSEQVSMFGGISVPGKERERVQAVTYNKEEYQKSQYFREGVQWQDGWSEQRARVMAEDYDERRYREELLRRRTPVAGFGEQVLGFGATLLGNLPDPINLMPLSAGMKGGSFIAAARRAAFEGAAGTALADAIVIPDLRARGEDIGFADAVADVAAGAVLGGLLGGAGYGVSKALDGLAARRSKLVDGTIDRSAREMNAPSVKDVINRQPADFEDVLSMKVWDGTAPASASRAADAVSLGTKAGSPTMTPEDLVEAKIGARMNITGVERQEIHAMLEDAIGAVADGRSVDLGDAITKSEFYKKLPEEIQSAINTSIAKADEFVPPVERIEAIDKAISEPVELAEVKRLREEGRLLPEEENGMVAAEAVEKQIDSYEESGLQIAECVWGVDDA